jgi:hypothetical protein
MTPQPPALLDELWESIPTGPAPVEDLVSRGRSRRRRRLSLAGGVAALVLAAGAFVVQPHSDDHVATGLVSAPPGTRYVGIGQVVVAVPMGWSDGAASCNSPRRDTVYFPWPQDCSPGSFRSVSSVAISSVPMNDGFAGGMTPDGSANGHEVVARPNPARCLPGTGPETCVQSFGVPDLDAYFSVRVPRDQSGSLDQVKAIRDSLRVLPAGQTAVPFVTPGSSLEAWEGALRDAGFAVRVKHSTCPPNAFCLSGVLGTEPAAGNVAPTGSTVTIEVLDP